MAQKAKLCRKGHHKGFPQKLCLLGTVGANPNAYYRNLAQKVSGFDRNGL